MSARSTCSDWRKCGEGRRHHQPIRIESPDGAVLFDFAKCPYKRFMITGNLDANMDEFERESNKHMTEIASRRKDKKK